MSNTSSAPLNGPAVGIILKKLVRRAIVTIRNERQVFDVSNKAGYGAPYGRMRYFSPVRLALYAASTAGSSAWASEISWL